MTLCSTTTPARRRFDATTSVAAVVTILGWASAFPAIRAALAAFGPLQLGALRFAIAALPAGLFLLVMRPPLPRLAELWRFLTGGLIFIALYTALLNIGEQTVSAGAASFIINVNPIITACLAMLILGENFGRRAWLGTGVSFLGVGLIALGEGQGLRISSGAVLILGSALCTSINTIVQKPLLARHSPPTVSAWNMVLGALFLAPFLPSGIAALPAAPAQGLVATLYLGIVPSFIGYWSWATVLSRLPAARAAGLLYCVPPVATLIGFLWLGELPAPIGILGGALALIGVAIVNLKPAR